MELSYMHEFENTIEFADAMAVIKGKTNATMAAQSSKPQQQNKNQKPTTKTVKKNMCLPE